MPTIHFVNETTVLTDVEVWRIAWACDYQMQYQYGRSGWRSDIRCDFLPGGAKAVIPAGGWLMHMLDTVDQPGALGYHDEDGNEIPFGRVGVKTTQADNQQVSEVSSHETHELATDQHVNDSCATGDLKRFYAKETGDPCQGNGYDIGAPEGKTTGVIVADFCLPNYFDPNTKPDAVTDFRGALKGPFSIAPQGYYSYFDPANAAAGWQQQVGAERTAPPSPDKDDRLRRRLTVLPQ